MKPKPFRLALILVASCGVLCLSGCQTDWYSKTSSEIAKNPVVATGSLLTGVDETYHTIGMATNAMAIRRGSTIPSNYWSAAIIAQHPIKVYEDIGNIVIVQKIADGSEYGKYIMPPVSSHMPPANFICTPTGASFVFNYRKNFHAE